MLKLSNKIGTPVCLLIPNGIPVIIDDNTNEVIRGNVYYVAVLNRVFGKESYEDWYENATRYKEDIPYEEKHFNYYAEKLGI